MGHKDIQKSKTEATMVDQVFSRGPEHMWRCCWLFQRYYIRMADTRQAMRGQIPLAWRTHWYTAHSSFLTGGRDKKQCSIKPRWRPSRKGGLPAAPHLWCCSCSCRRRLLLLDSVHLVGHQLSRRNDTRGRGRDIGKAGSSLAGAGHLTWMACHCRGLHNAGTDERQLHTVYICRHTFLFSKCILTAVWLEWSEIQLFILD